MKAKKFGAVAMALAMAGTMVPMSAFAEEEETQDFNGAEVRVFGNKWNELDPDAEGDKTQYLDASRKSTTLSLSILDQMAMMVIT